MMKIEEMAHKKSMLECLCHMRGVIAFLSVLYLLLGEASVTQANNPFMPEASLAINMTVVVFAGITHGRYTAMCVAFFGGVMATLYTYFTQDAGDISWQYNLWSILPHMMMGFFAGFIMRHYSLFIASLTIALGHTLNMLIYSLTGLFDAATFDTHVLFLLLTETMVDLAVINLACHMFYLSFPSFAQRW